MVKINYKTLKKIYQSHDEYYFVFKYKIIKYKKNRVINMTRYSDQFSAGNWHTGRLIWQS